ncbi:ogr/Delta-like zinc finger family protein [Aeromonas sp. BIGb0405]|uniref:ogr/Delta-like zinc finger family protein n=1 Tax=Aeromonas TaxID=642 RepID=UPI0038575462
MTAGVANLYCQCTDAECGHCWVSTLAYSHTLSPSAKRATDMAMSLARGLSPSAHGSLCESVNERQKQLDVLAAQEREKPTVTLRRAV